MNWDQVEGNWEKLKGTVKERWGRLTDDDIKRVEGSGDRLAGMLQQKYGIAKEKAEAEIHEWADKAKGMFESAKETVTQAVDRGKEYIQQNNMSDIASDIRDMIGKHPLPAALIGVGIGYLLGRLASGMSSSRS